MNSSIFTIDPLRKRIYCFCRLVTIANDGAIRRGQLEQHRRASYPNPMPTVLRRIATMRRAVEPRGSGSYSVSPVHLPELLVGEFGSTCLTRREATDKCSRSSGPVEGHHLTTHSS